MKWYEYSAAFVMLYPGVMSVYWTLSGLLYFLLWERRKGKPVFGGDAPMVSVLVPCFNEADNLDASIPHLLSLTYPNYELIFINDGSKDDTLSILRRWEAESDKITVLDQKNGGKASAMNHGASRARGKYIVGIDGDAVPDYGALEYIVETLEKRPDVGAITGNPRVRNRSTILGKLQVAEFSSIIGLIKRSQSLAGTLFTVSGVIMCIRKDVWRQIGGWSENMITDDIDISWKTQLHGYEIMYEPRALCWVLMPETIRGLYKQRLRWAQGGAEVILKSAYFPNRHLPLKADLFSQVAWQIRTRSNAEVRAWMPMLAFDLGSGYEYLTDSRTGKPTARAVKRLSPFNAKNRKAINEIYEDLSFNSRFNGLAFSDDGFITEYEAPNHGSDAQKTDALIGFSKALTESVLKYSFNGRDNMTTVRGILPETVMPSEKPTPLAQNLAKFAQAYNQASVTAPAASEQQFSSLLQNLKATGIPAQKLIVNLQARQPDGSVLLDSDTLAARIMQARKDRFTGIAYSTDGFTGNQPDLKTVKPVFAIR